MKIPVVVKNDPWLTPYTQVFNDWSRLANEKELSLSGGISLFDFASGYLYFGLHKQNNSWVLREWLPNAKQVFLIGTFNNWEENEDFRLVSTENGNWEIVLPLNTMKHLDLYALSVHWDGGHGKRVPAWATRVVQDPETYIFNAQVWDPAQPYRWKNTKFKPSTEAPFIYETHEIGRAHV